MKVFPETSVHEDNSWIKIGISKLSKIIPYSDVICTVSQSRNSIFKRLKFSIGSTLQASGSGPENFAPKMFFGRSHMSQL